MMPTFSDCCKTALRVGGVLAALALFAGSLFALARLREKSPKEQCMSNLRSLAAVLKTYADDYDNKLPGVGSGTYPQWTHGNKSWEVSLLPYLHGGAVPPCPKAGATTSQPYSYFYNRRVSGHSEGDFQHPALCVMFGDWVTHGPDLGADDTSTTWDIARSKQAAPAGSWLAGERHAGAGTLSGGAVYYFVDGHAKLLRRGDILPGNTLAPPPGTDTKASFYP